MKVMGKQSIDSTFIPLKILENYELIAKNPSKNTWTSMSETDIWNELCFCIFSANVNYDLAKSTLNHLAKNNFINPRLLCSKRNSFTVLKNELSKSIYLPKRKMALYVNTAIQKKEQNRLYKILNLFTLNTMD